MDRPPAGITTYSSHSWPVGLRVNPYCDRAMSVVVRPLSPPPNAGIATYGSQSCPAGLRVNPYCDRAWCVVVLLGIVGETNNALNAL